MVKLAVRHSSYEADAFLKYGHVRATLRVATAPFASATGTTLRFVLRTGSNALDRGNEAGGSAMADQRGVSFARSVDLPGVSNASGGDRIDIGAFAAQSAFSPRVDAIFRNGFETPPAPCRRGDGGDELMK